VKSPTFTVVEPYEIGDIRAFHFDLYRLVDPEELEFMGIRDYFEGDAAVPVRVARKGAGVLPKPDLTITISPQAGGRSLNLSPQGSRRGLVCRTGRKSNSKWGRYAHTRTGRCRWAAADNGDR
jgi:tRNA threonylcarbamoyladenosine biosynthesis protein TsaE